MRNKHPGICYRCGKTVEKGKGHFEKNHGQFTGGKWRLQHTKCCLDHKIKRIADALEGGE